jgi:hypothetical protein
LIREIDEARREAEAKPEKKRFGLFKRGKMAEKKKWETYDVDRNAASNEASELNSSPGTVLFDIEAIRAELHSEAIEVKELESTMPVMKVDLNSPSGSVQPSPTPKELQTPATPPTTRTSSTPLPVEQYSPPERSVPRYDEPDMTFDTSFHESPRTSEQRSSRPELRTASTMPNIGATAVGAMAMEPNAWADHGGHEDEISMTFE